MSSPPEPQVGYYAHFVSFSKLDLHFDTLSNLLCVLAEVASVKLHSSDDQRVMMVAQPGGRFVAANIPLPLLIRTAFQLQDDQIVGGPSWLAS